MPEAADTHMHQPAPKPSAPVPPTFVPCLQPGIGSVGGFSGNHKSTEWFFSFTSFTEPVSGLAWAAATDTLAGEA